MTDPSSALLKVEMRRRILSQRRKLPSTLRLIHDRKINHQLQLAMLEMKITSLSAFWPFDGEPDIRPTLSTLESCDVGIALPVLQRKKPGTIAMHRWQAKSRMVENHFKILEPVFEPVIDISSLDLLLIPLVAWDRKGHRLGMGAGYYDRLLAPLPATGGPRLIGVAYGVQETNEVPVEDFDVPLHGMIYEEGLIEFS
jgi:5-formyltetrahydrofolate cyclo-ligase